MTPLRRPLPAAAGFGRLCSAAVLLAAAFASASAPGCGVKSAPIPPVWALPERITSLRAESRANGIRLSWSRPRRTTGNHRLTDLSRFVIFRSEQGQGPLEPYEVLSVTDQARFRQARAFTYLDRHTVYGRRYRYAVAAETADGYRGVLSNEAAVRRAKPPRPETFVLPTPRPLP